MENENKLPPEFKAKWVEALRSGKYKQGKGCLHKDGKYCCLGVAYEVATGIVPDDSTQVNVNLTDYKKVPDLLLWHNPDDSKRKLLNNLAEMNDGLAEMNDGIMGKDSHSFSQIADYIEANL